MLVHDTGRAGPSFDSTGKGGPRNAVYDFARQHTDLRVTYFEHPLWLNPCGLAMICRQVYDPEIAGR